MSTTAHTVPRAARRASRDTADGPLTHWVSLPGNGGAVITGERLDAMHSEST